MAVCSFIKTEHRYKSREFTAAHDIFTCRVYITTVGRFRAGDHVTYILEFFVSSTVTSVLISEVAE